MAPTITKCFGRPALPCVLRQIHCFEHGHVEHVVVVGLGYDALLVPIVVKKDVHLVGNALNEDLHELSLKHMNYACALRLYYSCCVGWEVVYRTVGKLVVDTTPRYCSAARARAAPCCTFAR